MTLETTERTDGFREAQSDPAGRTAQAEDRVLLFVASETPITPDDSMLSRPPAEKRLRRAMQEGEALSLV